MSETEHLGDFQKRCSQAPLAGEARWWAVALAVGYRRAAYASVSPLHPVWRHCVGAARFALPPAGGRPGAEIWHQEHQVGCSFAEIALVLMNVWRITVRAR